MRHSKLLPMGAIALLLAATACQKDNIADSEVTETATEAEIEPLAVTEAVSEVFKKNFFNTEKIEVIDFHLPDGTVEQRYKIEDDIAFSAEQFESLSKLENTTERNFYTNNLVSPRTLTIIGFTGGGGFALSNKEQRALRWAVNNYNQLNLEIRLQLTFGSDFQDKDMVVYNNAQNNPGASGGVAGFPSNGNPNKFIQIYGLDDFSTNVNEHVITHEIGHSVGFRHTDWFSRQSCGQNTNEGVGSFGANPVPGTPAGFDPTSIMLACFSSTVNGEFNNNDITALRFLY